MLRVSPSGSKAWYVQLDRTRKRKIADTRHVTAAVARFRAAELLLRAERMKRPAPRGADRTMQGFLRGRYLRWYARKSRYAFQDVRRLAACLGELGGESLDRVGISKIERWKLDRLGRVSPSTVRREFYALRKALDKACDWRLISDNPARRIRLTKQKNRHEVRVLSPTERQRLLAVLHERQDHMKPLVLLALHTGLGRGELFRLRWKEVYLGPNPVIRLHKSGRHQKRSRSIPLNATAHAALQEWKTSGKTSGHRVFPGRSGRDLRSIATAWRAVTAQAGLRDFRFSDCRHDFAAQLVQRGVPLTQVRDLLGHSSVSLTTRYASFETSNPVDAVNMLD